jgi:monoamine oxidase
LLPPGVSVPMTHSFDVIIIGGGLAGIAAAQRLTQAGRRVALVDARDRLGGRVWTVRDDRIDHPVELGAEWFDSYGTIHRLLAGRHSPMPLATGKFLRRVGKELRDIEEFADGGARIHRRLRELEGPDRTLAQALKECCVESEYAQATEMLRHYVSGFHAADPQSLSLEWLRQVEENQPAEASEIRSAEGLDHAVRALLSEIRSSAIVFLETVVHEVRWRAREVLVDCVSGSHAGTLRGQAAIVALPLAVLQSASNGNGGVQFTPRLPGKRRAFELIATGPVIKVNLLFDSQFWRDLPGLRDMLFLQDFSQPLPTWWTTSPVAASMLTGWAAGPQVGKVGSVRPLALQRTAIRSAAHALGITPRTVAKRLLGMHWHDWQADGFARGAYTWVRAGGVNAHRMLAAPLQSTLFFAGEATCGGGFNATMDGAIQSGWRAAAEILERG